MSAKSHISKTIASSWLSLVVVSVCQLVMVPVALGALDKVDFALFAVIMQMMLAIQLAEMGVSSACSRLLIDARAKGEERFAKVWMASICVFCIQAVVVLAFVLTLAPFLENIFNLEPEQRSVARALFLVVGAMKALGYVLSVFSTALFAGQKLSHVNMVAMMAAIGQLVVFTVAIEMGAKLWAYPISMGAILVITNVLIISKAFKYKLVGKFDLHLLEWEEIKSVFKLGMDVFVAAIFAVVMGNSLLLFSGHLLTLEQTAILAVNLKLVNMMTNILQRIPGSASPMLMKMVSEGNDTQFRVWWKLITKLTISASLLAAGMFVIWNQVVVSLWTSEDMVMGGGSVMLLSLIPFRYLVHFQFVNSLAIFKEIRKVKWMLGWEILLYTGLAWWLGKQFGLMGLLSANLLSMLGGALFYGMKWFAVFSQITLKELVFLLMRLLIPLLILLALCLLIDADVMGSGILGGLVLSAICLLLFAGVSYRFIMNGEDRNQLSVLIGRMKEVTLRKWV